MGLEPVSWLAGTGNGPAEFLHWVSAAVSKVARFKKPKEKAVAARRRRFVLLSRSFNGTGAGAGRSRFQERIVIVA